MRRQPPVSAVGCDAIATHQNYLHYSVGRSAFCLKTRQFAAAFCLSLRVRFLKMLLIIGAGLRSTLMGRAPLSWGQMSVEAVVSTGDCK